MYACSHFYLFSGLDYRIVCFGKQVVSSIWRDLHVKGVMFCIVGKYCYMYFHYIPFRHLFGFVSKILWKSDLLSGRNCSAKNNKYVIANVETNYVGGDVENAGADWAERINHLKKQSNEALAITPTFTWVRTVWKPQMKDFSFPWRVQKNQETFCRLEWMSRSLPGQCILTLLLSGQRIPMVVP